MRKFRFYICIFYLIESHALHVFHNVTWQQYRRHQFRSENPRRFLAVTPKGPCVHKIRDICDAHKRAFVLNIDTHAHSAVHPFYILTSKGATLSLKKRRRFRRHYVLASPIENINSAARPFHFYGGSKERRGKICRAVALTNQLFSFSQIGAWRRKKRQMENFAGEK